MSFTSFKEQFKNVILEYLSPEAYKARLQKSTDIASRQAPKRGAAVSKQFDNKGMTNYYLGSGGGLNHPGYDEALPDKISKLSDKRKERVAKAQRGRQRFGPTPNSPPVRGKPTRLSKRGFDDQPRRDRPVKVRKPSYDGGHRVRVGNPGESAVASYGTKDNLEKIRQGKLYLDSDARGVERWWKGKPDGKNEQFKNAILNYLEEEFKMMQNPGTPQERLTVPKPVKHGDMVNIRRGAEKEARDKDDQEFAANRKRGGTRDDQVPSKNPMRRGSAQNRGKKNSTIGNFSESFKGQIKNVILNYLDEWTAEGVMKAAKKRGTHPDGDDDETGNTRDVGSRHDAGKTTRVTKNDDGTVTVDRSDASKYERDSKGKTIKGKYKRRSRSDSRNKRVIKP